MHIESVTTVLLVDDDELVREMVATFLAEWGFTVLKAGDRWEALAIMERTTSVDAVVLDILMPAMEGIEALREIRKRRPRLPVLVVSGGDPSGWTCALEMAVKLGANRALSKPFTPIQLLQKLWPMITEAKRG